MIKILITAGGTQEHIDDVRVMTNISTGKLGAIIANKFSEIPFLRVYYICGKNSQMPNNNCYYVQTVRSAKDAMIAMEQIITREQIDIVIHSMAVSDFTFNRDNPVKCKSSDPEAFIEFMRKTIVPNPKIISMIKQWRPEVFLVGFKFEVGLTNEELIALANESIQKNKCDIVIANDKKEMERHNSHIAYFVFTEDVKEYFGNQIVKVTSKEEIAETLAKLFTSKDKKKHCPWGYRYESKECSSVDCEKECIF